MSVTTMTHEERCASIARMILADPKGLERLLARNGKTSGQPYQPNASVERKKRNHREWSDLNDEDFQLFWRLRERLREERKVFGTPWHELSEYCGVQRCLSKWICPERFKERKAITMMRAALRRLGVHNV